MSTLSNNRKSRKNSQNKILNIKSKYILLEIFNYIIKPKLLSIIKYNKSIKKKVDISVKDYEECPKIYSSIELVIRPILDIPENIINFQKGEIRQIPFINIKKEEEKYFHIYFNKNKKETKKNYLRENEKVNVIKIKIDYQITSFNKLFFNCKCIESIYFKKFYRINITDMSGMFYECSSLKKFEFDNFITDNVTDMSIMFSGCSSLKELNLNAFNTNNVTSMFGMFSRCSSLVKLDINNFNANKVTQTCFMFSKCSSLKELYFSNFKPNKGTDVFEMFEGCTFLINFVYDFKNDDFKNNYLIGY